MKTFLLYLVVIFLFAACEKETQSNSINSNNSNVAALTAEQSTCPAINPSNFGSSITNPYFPLVPGTVFHYVNRIIDGTDTSYEQDDVSVLADTKNIDGVDCRTVHDVVMVDGQVTEDTYDWYAQDTDGNVWYFGEQTKSLKDKNGSTKEGSWKAGTRNDCPGVIMWANPDAHKGEIYYQEFLPGTAEDQAQVISSNNKVTVPDGTFSNCLKTKEFTALEPGVVEYKYYAANVGLLKTEMTSGGNELEVLTSITH